jgi:hypothetical protein
VFILSENGISVAKHRSTTGLPPQNMPGDKMIYIKETFPDDKSVSIKVDGVLDEAAIPVLNDLFLLHFRKEKKILIDLKYLISICREGVDFLQQLESNVEFIDPPPFIKLRKTT